MSPTGFDALYRQHYPTVLGICRRMLGGAADAEDATQEVFMRGYRAFSRYKKGEAFGPWINTIASNHCIDLLRKRKRLAGVFAESTDPPDFPDPLEHGVAALISAHRAGEIIAAVDALPDQYRLPIVLAYYADASYDDIAKALAITRNHVGVLLLRGKSRLREILAENNQES